MGEKIIYNYKLIFRNRRSPIFISIYFWILVAGIVLSFLFLQKSSWQITIIIIGLYHSFYLIWGVFILYFLNRKWKLSLPFLPWFGLLPKNLISSREFFWYELSYIIFLLFSNIWISLWFSHLTNPFIYAYILTLFLFRTSLFVRLIPIRDKNTWIKYESYGLSVYQTD